jgi:hypothetical protein
VQKRILFRRSEVDEQKPQSRICEAAARGRVMIGKRSGKVSYAVLSFGGFLGIGDDHYLLPWESLKYDTGLGGYRTGITETSRRVRRNTALELKTRPLPAR